MEIALDSSMKSFLSTGTEFYYDFAANKLVISKGTIPTENQIRIGFISKNHKETFLIVDSQNSKVPFDVITALVKWYTDMRKQ